MAASALFTLKFEVFCNPFFVHFELVAKCILCFCSIRFNTILPQLFEITIFISKTKEHGQQRHP